MKIIFACSMVVCLGTTSALAFQCAEISSGGHAKRALLWSSLEQPPTIQEARKMAAAQVAFAEFDVKSASPETLGYLADHGVAVFAYNLGNGGGAEWGEPIGMLSAPDARDKIRKATLAALSLRAKGLHLDNVHDLSEGKLESLLDAQIEAAREHGQEPSLHLKNATGTYLRILTRRPELLRHVKLAVIEHLSSSPSAARRLASLGVPVFGIEFAVSSHGSPTAGRNSVRRFVQANPWVSGIWALPNEDAYECRSGIFLTPKGTCTAAAP